MPLIGKVLKQLAKSVLILLGLTAAALATNAAINQKMFGSGNATLIISNEKLNDIMKIVKSYEDLVYWWKILTKQLKMNQKNKTGDFLVS